MRKYRISYDYSDSGMEGRTDSHPERIIEAPSREMALYIYTLMFFSDRSLNLQGIDHIRSYGGESITMVSFEDCLRRNESSSGFSVKEL